MDAEKTPEEQLKELEEADLDVWYYYGGVLFTLAKKQLREDRWGLDPDLIVTHAEILTEGMKSTIREAFDAPVHDEYGTTEFNRMAWQCEEGNYHLDSDSLYVEFQDTELGTEPVITSLVKKDMPMIRYRMGDIVERKRGECACGRGLPMIEPPEGRKGKFINGVSPRSIVESLADVTDFLMYRVEKNEEGLSLKYVPNTGFSSGSVDEALDTLEELLGERPEPEEVDYLEKTRGGKRPMVDNLTSGSC
ncbi:MAG: hypothetical protein ABEJ98_00480 [Candidatus Nanohaloarchaea archaeon]